MELSLVVPCFNEEASLPELVREARETLPGVARGYEIVVVDDGSSDRTSDVMGRLAAENPEVRPLRHDRNMGMGAAVRTGIAHSRGELILVVPGDNQFALDQVPTMLAAGREADVVVGERSSAYATTARSLPSRLYTLGMRFLFGLRMRGEVNLYRRGAVQDLGATSNGFFGNTELLIRALRRGCRAVVVPVRFRDRTAGRATGRDPRRILQVVRETAAFFIRLQLERFRR